MKQIMFATVLVIFVIGLTQFTIAEEKKEPVNTISTMSISMPESWYTTVTSDTETLYDVETATYDGTEFMITLKVNEIAINKASGTELDKIKNTLKVKMRDNGRNQLLSTKNVYDDYNKTTGKITYSYNILADYVTETLVDTYNETGYVNGTELKNIITTRKEVTLKLGENSIYVTATLGTDLVIQVTTPTAYNATLDVSACDLIINSSVEDKLIDISNSACTYDTIMNSNLSYMADIPETGHNFTFNPTNIIENQTTVSFNTTDAGYFDNETVTISFEYLNEQNLTRVRISNTYALNQYDLLNFNLTEYLGWNPDEIINVWYDSYTGNTDNSTLKDTNDWNTWVDTCESGNTTGLVGCWNFNELDGTIAKDRANNSANNNDGDLTNMNEGMDNSSSGWTRDGKYGNALDFDGTDDYVDCGTDTILNNLPITLSAWVKSSASGSSAQSSFINKYQGGSNNGYDFKFEWGWIKAWYYKNSTSYIDEFYAHSQTYNDGLWHNAVVLFNSSGGYIYVDGTFDTSLGWTGASGSSSTAFRLAIGSSAYNGTIDEVKIYNRALSASEISDEYNLKKDYFDSMPKEESGLTASEDWDLFVSNGSISSCIVPSVNFDWTIIDECEKDNENIELGTGSLIIDADLGGKLILRNSANIYSNDLQLLGSGEHINIFSGDIIT